MSDSEASRISFTIVQDDNHPIKDHPAFKLYGILGAGATLYSQQYEPNECETDKDNKLHFNFQVSPIGIKSGNNIGVFAEAGFGYKGMCTPECLPTSESPPFRYIDKAVRRK